MNNNNNHIIWMWIKVTTVLLGITLFISGMIMDFQHHPASEEILKGGLILVTVGFLSLALQDKNEGI